MDQQVLDKLNQQAKSSLKWIFEGIFNEEQIDNGIGNSDAIDTLNVIIRRICELDLVGGEIDVKNYESKKLSWNLSVLDDHLSIHLSSPDPEYPSEGVVVYLNGHRSAIANDPFGSLQISLGNKQAFRDICTLDIGRLASSISCKQDNYQGIDIPGFDIELDINPCEIMPFGAAGTDMWDDNGIDKILAFEISDCVLNNKFFDFEKNWILYTDKKPTDSERQLIAKMIKEGYCSGIEPVWNINFEPSAHEITSFIETQ